MLSFFKKTFKNFRRSRPAIISTTLGFLVVLVPVAILVSKGMKVKADWYDEGYTYRQTVSFIHNENINEQRRVSLTLDTETLISEGKMRSDCNDTRFTEIGGTVLRYQLTSGCNTSSTQYDIVLNKVTTGNNRFYIYYHNHNARSESDSSVSLITPLTPSGSSAGASGEEIGPSPSIYLGFDEGAGTTAHDYSPNRNDGVLGGSNSEVSGSKIRQEINIIDGTVSTSGDYPALVKLDTNKYNGTKAYYFEVVAKVSSGTLTVALERAGTSTQDSTITVTETDFTRKRSTAFTPPAGATEYNINLSGGTLPEVKAARIIVVQDTEETPITSTETQIEIGNHETGKSNTSLLPLASPKYWKYDADNWDGDLYVTAEVTYVRASDGDVTDSQTFSSGTGSWTAPDNVEYVTAECWGGGGGGGGGNFGSGTGGGGGGGGEYRKQSGIPVISGNNYSYSVGNGGSGSDDNANNGDSSSFNSTSCVAVGGSGGTSSNNGANGGSGGSGGTGATSAFVGGFGAAGAGNVGGGGGEGAGTNGNGGNASGQTGGTGTDGGDGGTGGDYGSNGSQGSSPGGGGGGGGRRQGSSEIGGNGANGQVKLTWGYVNNAQITIKIQEDNGNFGEWADKATVVSSGTSNTPILVESATFDPVDGRHYRLVSSIDNSGSTYNIYNAKIKVLSTGTAVSKLETQYLLANTKLSSGSTPQNFDTYYNPGQWAGVRNYYYHIASGASGSTSSVKLQTSPNSTPTDIVGTAISPSNQTVSGAFSAPQSAQTIDVAAATNNNDVYSSAITVLSETVQADKLPIWHSSEDCINGGCLFFDGSDDIIEVSEDTAINFGKALSSEFTVQAWVKPTSPGENENGRMFTKGDYNYISFSQGGSEDLLSLTAYIDLTGTDASVTIDNALRTNEWSHVAVTYNNDSNDEILLYVNGKKVGESNNGSGAPVSENNLLYVGGAGSYNYEGFIDDFKMYPKERTVEQILSDMVIGSPTTTGTNVALGTKDYGEITDIVAHWMFDEDGGSIAYDESENHLDLTITNTVNSPSYTLNGKYGSAFYPNGTSYASINNSAFDFDSSSFSLSVWVKSNTSDNPSANEYIISRGGTSGSPGFQLFFNTSGNIAFAIDDDSTWEPDDQITSNTDLYDGIWHHVVAVKTGSSKMDLYVDGVLVTTKDNIIADASLDGNSVLYIGAQSGSSPNIFAGTIDDLMIVGTALSMGQAEISYNRGSMTIMGGSNNDFCVPGDDSLCNGPYWGRYKFDDNKGTSIKDSSTKNIHGVLEGIPVWVPGVTGSAIKLDGETNYITTSSQTTGLDIFKSSQTFTFSSWVKIDELSDLSTVMSSYHDSTDNITIQTGSGSLGGGSDDILLAINTSSESQGYGYTNTDVIVIGEWAQWVVVFDGTKEGNNERLKFYLNGIQQPLQFSGTIPSVTPPYQIFPIFGAANTTPENLLNGSLDDLKIYNYARTLPQIAWEHKKGKAVAEWLFDECSGKTIHDESGSGTNLELIVGSGGTRTNAGTCGSGNTDETWSGITAKKFGANVGFDGSDDYAKSTNNSLLAPSSTSYTDATWGGWFYPTSSPSSRTLIHKDNEFKLTTNAEGKAECHIFSGGSWLQGVTATTAIKQNAWTQLSCVYNGAQLKIYYNGQESASINENSPITSTNATALNINRDPNGTGYFKGGVDKISIFSYALTPELLRNSYNNGAVSFTGP